MSADILKHYCEVLSFDKVDISFIPVQKKEGNKLRSIYMIKESSLDNFTSYIINSYSPIEVPKTSLGKVHCSEIDFELKSENEIKCRVCVNEHHFIPYRFRKEDILFFFKPNNERENIYPFVVIKDDTIEEMLNAEHGIYGLIDMSKGSSLLLERDSSVKEKMNKFQKEIDRIGKKYRNIMLITIGDSVLIKNCFKILEKGKLNFSRFDFIKIIKCFSEIKKSIDNIFNMNCYGVFTYGCNKSGILESDLKNVFHSGILSEEFKLLISFEECIKRVSDKRDIYLTKSLYQSYRYYVRQEYEKKGRVCEYSGVEYFITELKNHKDTELKEATGIKLANAPFLINNNYKK